MAQANVAYTSNYIGGVKQFVDDKVTAFHTLNEMDNPLFTTDQSKIAGLHDSFQQSTDTWAYAQAISTCTNYAQALDLLNNLITIEEHSNRHAAHLSQVQNAPTDADDEVDNILHVNFHDVPPGLQLNNELRNVLSRDTLRLIVQERNDHLEGPNANNGGGDTQNKNRPFNSSFNHNPRPKNRPTDNRVQREPRPPTVIGQQYGSKNPCIFL
eukprot:scaffold214670_cov64-Attheya_sp.AAC.1